MKLTKLKKIAALAVSAALVFTSVIPAFADSSDTYVAFGADLTQEQKASVLTLLDLDGANLDELDTVTITNAMEHEMLGSYLPKSVIGSRALSCVRVDKTRKGGINVQTKNITYCTEGMYQNALITAGIENADVIVAAPFNISGTAGLVGAMKAYQEITGKEIKEENADAAVEEIVTTGQIADAIGSTEKAENFVALAKQKVIANSASTDEEIMNEIDAAAKEIGLQLTDAEKQKLLKLLKKIANLDLDVDTLKKQAGQIYDRLQDMGIDMSGISKEKAMGFFERLLNWIMSLFS